MCLPNTDPVLLPLPRAPTYQRTMSSLEGEYFDRVVVHSDDVTAFGQVDASYCGTTYSVERRTLMHSLAQQFLPLSQEAGCDFVVLIKTVCDALHPIMHLQTMCLYANMSPLHQLVFLHMLFEARRHSWSERLTLEEIAEGDTLSGDPPDLEYFDLVDSRCRPTGDS